MKNRMKTEPTQKTGGCSGKRRRSARLSRNSRLPKQELGNKRKTTPLETFSQVLQGCSYYWALFTDGVSLSGWDKTMDQTATIGHLSVLKWLHSNMPDGCSPEAMNNAAENGHLCMVEWLHTNRTEGCTQSAMNKAAMNGHLCMLEWLHTNRDEGCSCVALTSAAKNGHFAVIQWLLSVFPGKFDQLEASATLTSAASGGHLALVEWLHPMTTAAVEDFYLFNNPTAAMDRAATNGHLDVVEWLHAHRSWMGEGCSPHAMHGAATNGHLDVVEWLHANTDEGCRINTMDGAAGKGHLAVVEWFHAHHVKCCRDFRNAHVHVKCSIRAMEYAASNGQLHVVEWLHANRSEGCTRDAMDRAAANGHLSVVEWLHDNRSEGCTTLAMNLAAENGHLSLVEWLHANRSEGCTTLAMDRAADNGHLSVVEFLHANCSEGCTTDAMDSAAEKDHLYVVEWLHANRTEGCTTRAMNEAAARSHLRVVEWLHANRSEGCTTDAMDAAASRGHLLVVEWLHAHRSEGCTTDAMDGASEFGSLSVVEWLHAHRSEGCTRKAIEMAEDNGHESIKGWLLDQLERQPGLIQGRRVSARLLRNETFLSRHDEIIPGIWRRRERRYKMDVFESRKAVTKLTRACEQTLNILSISNQTALEVDSLMDGLDLRLPVSRARFEDLVGDLLPEGVMCINEALAEIELVPASIDLVLLSGGVTSMPRVQNIIQHMFPQSRILQAPGKPEEVVALGATWQAFHLSNQHPDTEIGEEFPVLPESVGILNAEGGFIPVLTKGCFLPASADLEIACTQPSEAEGTSVAYQIQVCEGEELKTPLGVIILRQSKSQAGTDSEEKAVLHFSLGLTSGLEVTAHFASPSASADESQPKEKIHIHHS